MQIPQKLVYEKFYVHEIAAVDLSKIYFLKNAKKTCKPNNRDLNRNWIKGFSFEVKNVETVEVKKHAKKSYLFCCWGNLLIIVKNPAKTVIRK